jgi:hypothetical protein
MSHAFQLARARRNAQSIQKAIPYDAQVRKMLREHLEHECTADCGEPFMFTGFFPRIEEEEPDEFFFIHSPDGLRPVMWKDLMWNSSHHIDFSDLINETPGKSWEECAAQRREQRKLESRRPGNWHSHGVPLPRPRTNNTSRHQQLLDQLKACRDKQFVELTVHFNDHQTKSMLLFNRVTINGEDHHVLIDLIEYEMFSLIPFEETISHLIHDVPSEVECIVNTVKSWSIVGM